MTVAIGDLGVSINEYLDSGETDAVVGGTENVGAGMQLSSRLQSVSSRSSKTEDLCDAGSGVGITNEDVIYRVCAESIICGYDYYNRIHLAPGDISNNEVERIQSSVGHAVCDGGYLDFDHYG